MDSDDAAQLIAYLKQHGVHELYQVVGTFRGYRRDQQGRNCELSIDVLEDMSGSDPSYRFVIEARDDLNRHASGNGGETVEVAAATTHWEALDAAPEG